MLSVTLSITDQCILLFQQIQTLLSMRISPLSLLTFSDPIFSWTRKRMVTSWGTNWLSWTLLRAELIAAWIEISHCLLFILMKFKIRFHVHCRCTVWWNLNKNLDYSDVIIPHLDLPKICLTGHSNKYVNYLATNFLNLWSFEPASNRPKLRRMFDLVNLSLPT